MGGGAYGGMRLLHDMGDAAKKPSPPKDELQLTLPSARIPKTAEENSPLNYLLPLLASGGGMAGGWMGASSLYDNHRQKKLKEEQDEVEKQYMHTLQQAHNKVASLQTPLVDKFLEGVITKAGEQMKEAFGWGDLPSEGIGDTIKHQGSNMIHGAANSELGSAAIATWLAAAMGTGGLTYGIARNMDKNKQKNRESTTLPQDIRLNVV